MTPELVLNHFPYPIAGVYADLDRPGAAPATRRDVLAFTCYQLLRTVGLTLAGQYLTSARAAAAPIKPRQSVNKAIAAVRSPHFNDWISLVGTLRKHADALGLDAFPGFTAAMARMEANRVTVPPEYGLEFGARYQQLTWFEAFLSLRNSSAHSGLARDEACDRAVTVFRPFLDALLDAFAFLTEGDWLVLRSGLDDDETLVQSLRGARPAEAAPVDVDEPLYRAFEQGLVVYRTAGGQYLPLFPLFHAHLPGEPVRLFDGTYLRDDPKMLRRTIFYLGSAERLPLDDSQAAGRVLAPAPADAGDRLRKLLNGRQVLWQLSPEQVAPWTLRDTVNDYARRTLADVRGVKYLPACYLDRPRFSGPLWQTATAEAGRRAMFVTGRAGSGKTAMLCDLVRKLLEVEDHLIFFLRGDGLLSELPGGNLLLANLLHKIGLEPTAFASFADLFRHLAERAKMDRVGDRRFVIVLDALNEAPMAAQFLREALEMVLAAQGHPWLRIILSARAEFLSVWSNRRGELEGNPFHRVRQLFVEPPEDPERPRPPEEPPVWLVPAFGPAEAGTVYQRYQEAKATGQGPWACLTPWEQLPLTTRTSLLTLPLHLHLWMQTFDGRQAPMINSEAELFAAYLDDLRYRFVRFWESMTIILDHMLARGRMELDDDDALALRERWQQRRTEQEQRRELTPLEVACASGLMDKRTREEGGGYRIPHQGLREQLLYARLKELDPALRPAALQSWLGWPATEELAGALARVARDLWQAGRAGETAALLASPLGRTALAQMLARGVEPGAAGPDLKAPLAALLAALPEGLAAPLRQLLLFDLPGRLEGLPVTNQLRGLWEVLLPWLGRQRQARPGDTDLAHAVSVTYRRLGNLYWSTGQGEQARAHYTEALEILKGLVGAGGAPPEQVRDLSLTHTTLGDTCAALGWVSQAEEHYREALRLSEPLVTAHPQRGEFTHDLAVTYSNLSDACDLSGQGKQALDHIRQSCILLKKLHGADPQDTALSHDLVVACNKYGVLLQKILGQGDKAQSYFHYALQIIEPLLAAHPQRSDLARVQAVSYNHYGDSCKIVGSAEKARAFYLRAQQIFERLVQAEPERTDLGCDLAVTYERLGTMHQDVRQGEQALAYFQRVLELREGLFLAEPQRIDFALNLAVSYSKLGNVYWMLERRPEAVEAYNRGNRLLEWLNEGGQRTDVARVLAVSYDKLGNLYRQLAHHDQALTLFRKSHQVLLRLHEIAPERTDITRDLALSYNKLSTLCRKMGYKAEAQELVNQGRALWQEVLQGEKLLSESTAALSCNTNHTNQLTGERFLRMRPRAPIALATDTLFNP